MQALVQSLRASIRTFRRSPGYGAAFILTLGIGIGPTAAILSVVYGTLLRPLPYRDGDRLVYIRQTAIAAKAPNILFSVPEIEDIRSGARTLARVAEFSTLPFTVLDLGEPRVVTAGIVANDYFGVMGLGATLGRVITLSDDAPTATAVAVLTYEFWTTALHADPDVVGRSIRLDGRPLTVIGVAEPAPPYPEETQMYVNLAASPHHLGASMTTSRTHRMTEVFARLAPGATVSASRAELRALMQNVRSTYPEAYTVADGFDVSLTRLTDQLSARARSILALLLAASGFLLLIAVSNVANLAITRATTRARDLAVRLSQGATGRALRGHLFWEACPLALAGTGLGLGLAALSLGPLREFAARYSPRASEVHLAAPVLLAILVITLGAAFAFTILPQLPSPRDLAVLMKGDARATRGRRGRRTLGVLVVVQLAASFLLLTGAGLTMRTLWVLTETDSGFSSNDVLTLELPGAFTSNQSNEVTRARHEAIRANVEAIPGVVQALWTSSVPLGIIDAEFGGMMQVRAEGAADEDGQGYPMADLRSVTPGYIRTLGVRLIEGRDLDSRDEQDTPRTAMINASLAHLLFPNQSPIGRRISWTGEMAIMMGMEERWMEVVGVVGDTRDFGIQAGVGPLVYQPTTWRGVALLVEAKGVSPLALQNAVRQAIHRVSPEQPIENMSTLGALKARAVAPERLNAILIGMLALLSILIAAVGIAGVLAFSVAQRVREFGIRSALGATTVRIQRDVLGEGLRLLGAGILLGVVSSLVLVRLAASLWYGVGPHDPLTFVTVGLLLAFTALAAAWGPAYRAANTAPADALRLE